MPPERKPEMRRLIQAMLGTALFVGALVMRLNQAARPSDYALLVMAVLGLMLLVGVWREVLQVSGEPNGERIRPVPHRKSTRFGRFIERHWWRIERYW